MNAMATVQDRFAEQLLPRHLRALLRPAAYPHPVESIELVQTHVSWVLLTGHLAYKIKRPVQYPFVDLRSAERRAFLCREELRLNRRFAAELYLDVCDITSDEGEARIGGQGEVIEHAVRMVQFGREDQLDRLLAAGGADPAALETFGRSLADIHARLPVVPAHALWGRAESVRSVVLENLEQCARACAPYGDPRGLHALRGMLSAHLERSGASIDERRAAGRVRECHGDLHARNVVQRDGRLLAFDCMEFSDAFRWIDVADEIAFLLADLSALKHAAHAHAFLSGYLAESGDYDACRVLGLYEAHRALVRAKVTALGWTDLAQAREVDLGLARRQYEAYVGVAHAALGSKTPLIVLVGGLSGSGKTWLASRLAPLLGAIHLRSDVERKRLAGLPESARTGSPLQQGLYTQEASTRVYEHLAHCAEQVASGGYPVIVDATFARREDRARYSAMASRLGAAVRLLHCRALPGVLRQRVAQRHTRGSDASEADLGVLAWQEAHAEPVGTDEGLATIEVDTTRGDPEPSIDHLVAALRTAGGAG
jgi:aminoglycoside phosphotransferase family enzyme/predicted kinase